LLRSEIPSGMCAKLRTMAASNHRDHARNLSYYCLLALHIWWCYSSLTSRSWWITQSTQHHRRGCNNIPSFLQRTTLIARSLCEGWTPHDLHILVTAPFCCDQKSRAACVQSFTPWQQATIEIMLAISLTIACSRYTYDGVILPAHPVRGESHNQCNTTREVATLSSLCHLYFLYLWQCLFCLMWQKFCLIHFAFSQTRLVEVVMWQVGYNMQRDKGLGLWLSYSLHNANKKLVTAFQHWNHNNTCPSD